MDETDEFEAMDVLGVLVQLLFLMSLTILFFSFLCSVSGCCVTSSEYWISWETTSRTCSYSATACLLDGGHTRRVSLRSRLLRSSRLFSGFFLYGPLYLAATCSVLLASGVRWWILPGDDF